MFRERVGECCQIKVDVDGVVSDFNFKFCRMFPKLRSRLNANAKWMTSLKRKQNCKGGDRQNPAGIMVSAGTRGIDGNAIDPHKATGPEQAFVMKSCKKYLEDNGFGDVVWMTQSATMEKGSSTVFPHAWETHQKNTRAGKEKSFSAIVTVSENLANESHVDSNDDGMSIAIFHTHKSNQHGKTTRYFLLPDVETWDGNTMKQGVAIEMVDGLVISWDGDKVRHCSSVPEIKGDALGHATFFCSAGRTNKGSKLREQGLLGGRKRDDETIATRNTRPRC